MISASVKNLDMIYTSFDFWAIHTSIDIYMHNMGYHPKLFRVAWHP